MKKREKAQKQKEALKLYLEGIAKHEIAKRLHASETTIRKWEKEQQWKEYYKENERKINENLSQDVVEEKKRTLQLIKAVEAKFAQQLQTQSMEIKPSEFAQIQRVKWEILMPRNWQQFNFMKQEINSKPTYEFIIDDGKNKTLKKAT